MNGLKSNWSRLEEKGSIGRTPKRGVGGFVSRNRQMSLVALGFPKSANEVAKLERSRKLRIVEV